MAGDPYQLQEFSKTLLFPTDTLLQQDIPLWMRFFAFEYSSTAYGRVEAQSRSTGYAPTLGIPIFSNMKAQITVPAQVSFISNTSLKYTNATTKAKQVFPLPSLFTKIPGLGTAGFMRGILEDVIGWGRGIKGFDSEIKPPDQYDLTFVGGGPSRSYTVSIVMPCISVEDSVAASSIARMFEALSLPTASGFGSSSNIKFYHPPMWSFGIGKSLDSFTYDKDWSGYPQLSVLQTVKVKKVPLEISSVVGVGSEGQLKPAVHVVSLVFSEMEPAVRFPGYGATTSGGFSRTTDKIVNRSSVMVSGPIRGLGGII